MISPAQGAATIVYLAIHPDVANVSGCYFEKNHPKAPSKPASSDDLAARLWAESARLTGIADEN